MRATKSPKQPAKAPAAIDLEAELDRIAAMNINELRSLWRERQGREREKPNLSKRSRFRSIGERHVRWLTPLAFLSPKIVTAIVMSLLPRISPSPCWSK